MLKESKINSNFTLFEKRLKESFGIDVDKLNEELPQLKEASLAISKDSGCAYPGSLIDKTISLVVLAKKINSILPEEDKVNEESLIKVCMLQHLSKAKTIVPNDNQWEIDKRGFLYKFNEDNTVLKCGALSSYIALRCGAEFSDEELEAMTIIDRTSDDKQASLFASTLSVVVRQANELMYITAKERVRNESKSR